MQGSGAAAAFWQNVVKNGNQLQNLAKTWVTWQHLSNRFNMWGMPEPPLRDVSLYKEVAAALAPGDEASFWSGTPLLNTESERHR
jgi:hypothetical protein